MSNYLRSGDRYNAAADAISEIVCAAPAQLVIAGGLISGHQGANILSEGVVNG